MNWLNNLRLSTKLFASFGAVLALTVLLTAMSMRDMSTLAHNATDITTYWLPAVDELHDTNTHAADVRISQLHAMSAETPEVRATNLQDAASTLQQLNKIGQLYVRAIVSDEERALWTEYSARWQKYIDLSGQAFRLLEQQKAAEAAKLLSDEGDRLYDEAGATLDALIELNRKGAAAATVRSNAIFARARVLAFVLLAIAIALGGTIAVVVSRSISKPVAALIATFRDISAGNLDTAIDTTREDEIGCVQTGLADMQANLRKLLAENKAQLHALGGMQAKYAGEVTAQLQQAQAMESTVRQAQAAIKAATEGDLTIRVPAEDKTGDLRRMAESINTLLGTLAEIVSKVQGAASEVHRGAEEISQGNANLSQRTEEQSSSLEETASSMEEMTSTVKQNADNAGQANQLATAARDQAEKGGVVTAQAVRAMSEINEASKKIADIIGVIDEIAFQTNLLALNAAVEAARAGEQGRGFAVVASEVRSLAGRSATAAKEIKDLIQDSVRKVQDGSLLVTQSGQTLEQIVASVKKVSDIVAEIAAASREQSAGIDQVNRAVMQMDEMTQQNAALVEEATAASQSMADQARTLNQMMARYRAETQPVRPELLRAERRSVARPWAGKLSAKKVPVVVKAVASGHDDTEWKDF